MTDEELEKIVPNGRDASYGLSFFKNLERAHDWCNQLYGKVLALGLQPKSVIELGCATGGVLQGLLDSGVQRVTGVDGSAAVLPFAERKSKKLAENIIVHDLRKPWVPPSGRLSYELVVTIETLEHLPPESADTVVDTICSCAPTAITTACPPVGRNPLHLNEQPPEYWTEKFEARGFKYDDKLTKALRSIMKGFYYLFERGDCPVVPAWFFSGYFQCYKLGG